MAYALGEGFSINDYSNWVPSHGDCNSRKNDHIEDEPSPALIMILQEVKRKATIARELAERLERDEKKSTLLARVQRAIEKGTLSRADVEELVRGLPLAEDVTEGDWEFATEDSRAQVTGHATSEARSTQHFSGWIQITFDEQEGLEAALLGRSMGPRHVRACPQVQEVAELVGQLKETGAVAVVGDSGSGKSMLAWHAAYQLHEEGWPVYFLTNPVVATGDLPVGAPRALLVVDDAQSQLVLPVSSAVASTKRAIMVVSTSNVAGFRTTVRIARRRCVKDIAGALRVREDELLPILSRLDSRIGARMMDRSVSSQIDDALKGCEFAWQFMFNLGAGELRIGRKLDALKAAPPLDSLIYAIAVYQLATRDTPCPLDWLLSQHAEQLHDMNELLSSIAELADRIELVRTAKGVATPHPRVAGVIVRAMFYGAEEAAMTRRRLLWNAFREPMFPLLGLRWLMDELPDDFRFFYGAPGDMTASLVTRCFHSPDIGGAGFLLANLASLRTPQVDVIRLILEQRDKIIRWIESCSHEEAYGVRALVNEIINVDREEALRLIDRVDLGAIAVRIHSSSPVDWYSVGGLLDRLAFGSPEWKSKVMHTLDREELLQAFASCEASDVGAASELVNALLLFDESFAVDIAEAIAEAVSAAMRADPREGFLAARDVFWWVLRFGPSFLLGSAEPEERHTTIAARILESVGAERLAEAFQRATRRHWHGLESLAALIRSASPALADAVSTRLDVEPMIASFREMNSYEMDHVLGALALAGNYEPAGTVVRRVCTSQGALSWRAAVVAPDAAAKVILAGGKVDLSLGGGLPSWDQATAVLALVHEVDPHAAMLLLRANSGALADSFLFRQSNGGDGAATFLKAARQVDDVAVREAMQAIDVAVARTTWPQRAQGDAEEQMVLRLFVELARDVGGAAGALAQEITISDEGSPAEPS